MEAEKLCPECNRPIFGRADKKFCSDMCRNSFNNKQNGSVNNLVRRVNGILKKNRRIMEELNPKGKIKVTKSKLVSNGFDFEFHTSIYTTKEGSSYYFCYEHGYLALDNDFYLLVKRDI
ncbi:MAG: hypothetical protein WBA74_07850 [Cyclobacteriaceae bacterium]